MYIRTYIIQETSKSIADMSINSVCCLFCGVNQISEWTAQILIAIETKLQIPTNYDISKFLFQFGTISNKCNKYRTRTIETISLISHPIVRFVSVLRNELLNFRCGKSIRNREGRFDHVYITHSQSSDSRRPRS